MSFSLFIRRWSHIGRKPIYVDASTVKFDLKEVNRDFPFLNFRVTKSHWILNVEGPLGKAKVPIIHGLKLEGVPSADRPKNDAEELQLKLQLDETNRPIMTKYHEKFVQAMWGTTNALLRNTIAGVTEVRPIASFIIGACGNCEARGCWIQG